MSGYAELSLTPANPIRIAVLVSGRGRGTNFQALLDGCRSGRIPGDVALLVSSSPDTPAMARASAGGVKAIYLPREPAEDEGDQALLKLLQDHKIDLICLAGFMRKVGFAVLEAYPNRIMNVHPSLLPAFAGAGMYGLRVHQAVLAYGAKISGCTVQFIDEEYDAGPIILQRAAPVLEEDTPETLSARVLEQEHAAYVEAVCLFAEGRLSVEGRRVHVSTGLAQQKGTV
ncbi:MAG TPA: phosphoribosylglycinamide formyltransferase [Armatimonadota bacterium]|nr:phosphoribosylglycinamide formyltransferase [Armatimonadota bacterium]